MCFWNFSFARTRTFNKNRSCIEIKGTLIIECLKISLIKTEVVLKYVTLLPPHLNKSEFNKNRSCIEILQRVLMHSINQQFNKNRSCIEIWKHYCGLQTV